MRPLWCTDAPLCARAGTAKVARNPLLNSGVVHHVEDTLGASEQQDGRPAGESLLESAVRYAEERHWDVCPGAWLEEDEGGGPPRCACGNSSCAERGAHPLGSDWAGQASGSAGTVRRMWTERPRSAIVMPTGRSFDVLDVPEVAGCLALARMERMGVQLGPVAGTPDRRLQFFVLPGAAAKVPDLLRRLGWVPSTLDLVARGEGGHVLAPPSRVGDLGAMLWARPPTTLNRWLPETEELLGPLAYACARDAAAARSR